MATGAGMVYSGNDNTGAAAIVNSTQEDSFIDGIYTNYAAEQLRLKKEKEKAAKDALNEIKDIDYDYLGDVPLDEEGEALVLKAEDYAVEQYKLGKNPTDITTPEGKEFERLKREARRNAAQGKAANQTMKLVFENIGNEDVDQEEAKAWINGYKDIKPQEGETLAQARARYANDNPYSPSPVVGTYSFVSPILDNIQKEVNGRVSALNKPKVMAVLSQHLLLGDGEESAKKMMKKMGLDYGNPNDVQKFLESQYSLIESANPKEVKPATGGGNRSAKNTNTTSSGGGKSGYVYEVSYSENENMMQDGKSNGILLRNSTGTSLPEMNIKVGDGVERGVPTAIVKDTSGNLKLEYVVSVGEKENKRIEKRYVDYPMFRDEIISMYGSDISNQILDDAEDSGDSPKAEKVVSSGGVSFTVVKEGEPK